jgi:hypothetical protein
MGYIRVHHQNSAHAELRYSLKSVFRPPNRVVGYSGYVWMLPRTIRVFTTPAVAT